MSKAIMKPCYFCTNNIKQIDYKDTASLSKFIDPFGRIQLGRRTGVCAKHQRKLATAIKRARMMALMPFVAR